MSAWNECKICKRYMGAVPQLHKCPPLWLCLEIDNQGDDWDDAYKIYAGNPEAAARDAAEEMDSDCGEGAHERKITVKSPSGEITVWAITFDYSVDYYASEVKP